MTTVSIPHSNAKPGVVVARGTCRLSVLRVPSIIVTGVRLPFP